MNTIKCSYCGKFCSYGTTIVHFEPDSAFGPERIEYECVDCQVDFDKQTKNIVNYLNARLYLEKVMDGK